MKRILVIALIALALVGVVSCSFIEKNVKSVVKINCTDEKGSAYGYLTVFIMDGTKVVVSDQLNERGMVVLQGVPAGTYTLSAKNAAQIELKVISPASISVRPGKTVEVDLKVQSAAPVDIPD
jgi:hypothetical protein